MPKTIRETERLEPVMLEALMKLRNAARRHFSVVAFNFIAGMIFFALSPVQAQNFIDTGLQPYHAYHGGNIDHINLDNGNLTVTIPLVSYPQRGNSLAMTFALVFNNGRMASLTKTQQDGVTCGPKHSCGGGSGSVAETTTTKWYASLRYEGNLLPIDGGIELVDTQGLEMGLKSLNTDYTAGTGCTPGQLQGSQGCSAPGGYITAGGETSQVTWYSADGGAHPAGQTSTGQISLDGSGYQNGNTYALSLSNMWGNLTCNWGCSQPGMIAVNDGITYYAYGQGPSMPTGNILRQDADGNYISNVVTVSQTPTGIGGTDVNHDSIYYNVTQYTDTVGRVIPIPSLISSPTAQEIASCGGPLPVSQIAQWTPPGYSNPFLFCYATATLYVPSYSRVTGGAGTITSDSGESSTPLLQNVVLPNGQAWTFEYNEDLSFDMGVGDTTAQVNLGDLTHITFPTGGTIDYTYQFEYGSAAPPYNSSTTAIASRTINANDGSGPHQWLYSFALNTSTIPISSTMTITDPLNNIIKHTLVYANYTLQNNGSRTTIYSDSDGNMLKTIIDTYPWQYSTWNGFPLWLANEQTTLGSGQSYLTTYSYCCDVSFLYSLSSSSGTIGAGNYPYSASNGKITDAKVYDYSGALLRETKDSYIFQSNSSYSQVGFFDLKLSETVLNGGGTQMAQTTYGYDETGRATSGIAALSGAQMTTPLYGVYGHQTSKTTWLNSGPSSPKSTVSYYDTGEAYQTIDPLLNTTTTNYSSTYWGALPTTVINALGQQSTYTYRQDTGQRLTSSDTYGNTITNTYSDPLNRLKSTQYPDGGSVAFEYNDSGSLGFTVTQAINSSTNKKTQAIVDGLGRLSETVLLSDSPGPSYALTTYDALGRKYQVWNQTRCTPSTTPCAGEETWGITTYGYDALGRMTSQTNPDKSVEQWCYDDIPTGGQTNCKPHITGAGVGISEWVDFADEKGNDWQRSSNALGQLTSVMEPNGSSVSPSMETDYSYNALGNMLSATQNGASGSVVRARGFIYDSLSRLTSASNPESGLVTYGYDANSNLTSKTSPAVNVSSGSQTIGYCYDALDRMKAKLNVAPSIPICASPVLGQLLESFSYDSSSVSGAQYTVGRLTDEKSYVGNTQVSERQLYAYDAMGRELSENRFNYPNLSTAIPLSYSYDLAGNPTKLTNSVGAGNKPLTLTSVFDGASRLSSVVADTSDNTAAPWPSLSANLFTINSTDGYWPQGTLWNWCLGTASCSSASPLSVTQTFNPRLLITNITATGQVP